MGMRFSVGMADLAAGVVLGVVLGVVG